VALPALEPAESVALELMLPSSADGRSVGWLTLRVGDVTLSESGNPALQIEVSGP
jgi:hypothetical protein